MTEFRSSPSLSLEGVAGGEERLATPKPTSKTRNQHTS